MQMLIAILQRTLFPWHTSEIIPLLTVFKYYRSLVGIQFDFKVQNWVKELLAMVLGALNDSFVWQMQEIHFGVYGNFQNRKHCVGLVFRCSSPVVVPPTLLVAWKVNFDLKISGIVSHSVSPRQIYTNTNCSDLHCLVAQFMNHDADTNPT